MRPPIPNFAMSRRAKIALGVAGSFFVVLALFGSLVGVYIDWLWFGEVDKRSVFTSMIKTRTVLFLIFGLLMAIAVGVNLVVAYALRPPFRPLSPEQQNLERYKQMFEPHRKLILFGAMAFVGFGSGMAAQANWREWLTWRYGEDFNVRDQQFGLDVGFFAWDYPVYRLLLGFGFGMVILSLLVSVGVHYLSGAIRLQTPGPKMTPAARRHLTILVFLFVLLKALAYWLDRYGLVFSSRGNLTGASYTDVHASLPAKTILFWIAILIAIAVLASLWVNSQSIAGIAFGVLLILSILINGIYPAMVQQFTVRPNAQDKEKPYIERNITATRQAYDIVSADDGGRVEYKDYEVAPATDGGALKADSATLSNLRVLDPNVVGPTFIQLQRIDNQYGFPAKLDIDRYPTGGTTRDYVVGVRELDENRLQGDQRNWINQRTVYTHGMGYVAAQANRDADAPEEFSQRDIPPTGFLNIEEPRVYYGELMSDYSIVGSTGAGQREYDGKNRYTTYTGTGGVDLNLLNRAAFGLKYREANFVLNDAVSAEGAKIIFNRNPRDRILKVAPFLQVDTDPYPVVVDGRIVWMLDGYTTISNYPYSRARNLSELTETSLTQQRRTAQQREVQINYIRNSVKATVDAYDGTVHLYEWDDKDPVLKTWMKAFPNVIEPRDRIPPGLLSHVRYPTNLFEVQRSLLAEYHVDDPVVFYNLSDRWEVPEDPSPNATGSQPPYYLLADDPSGKTNKAQFQLTSPMVVFNNQANLASYISVNCEPGENYGKFTVLKVPRSAQIPGPVQAASIFGAEPVVARDSQLFGNRLVHGNLLTLPVGKTFLYVEPLYLQREGAQGTPYPQLQAVLLLYGDRMMGYSTTISDALNRLSPRNSVPPLPSGGGTGTTSPPPPTSPPATTPPPGTATTTPPPTAPPTAPAAVLAELAQLWQQYQAAVARGDYVAAGQAQAKINDLLARYR